MYTSGRPRGTGAGGSNPKVQAKTTDLDPWPPAPLGGPLVYPVLFCYQIMTRIDKIVHYIILLLIGSVFNWCIKVMKLKEKSDTILHNIHPRPFDPYVDCICHY